MPTPSCQAALSNSRVLHTAPSAPERCGADADEASSFALRDQPQFRLTPLPRSRPMARARIPRLARCALRRARAPRSVPGPRGGGPLSVARQACDCPAAVAVCVDARVGRAIRQRVSPIASPHPTIAQGNTHAKN